MLELHRTKTVPREDGGEKKVGCYTSVSDIVDAMYVCLDSIGIIRNLTEGMDITVFTNARPILDRCAINYIIIGNHLGRLDPGLLVNDAMRTSYNERSVIAHKYGNRPRNGPLDRNYYFDLMRSWEDMRSDLDGLEDGCREVIDEVNRQEVVFLPNRKNPRSIWHRRRSGSG